MQTACPHCSHPLVVDDAKIPAGPFMLRCPKCQGTMRLEGKGGPAGPASSPSAPPRAGNGEAGRALLALDDAAAAGAARALLAQEGYAVEAAAELGEDAGLRLAQGEYAVVVTASNGAGMSETMQRLAPELRRRLFFVLVGEGLRSGDAHQAFAATADLVLAPADLGRAGELFRRTLAEKRRLYQAFFDAEARRDDGRP